MTNLEIIRAACIKANPKIIVNQHAQLIGWDHKVTYFEEKRPIRLADVLLAIGGESDTEQSQWRYLGNLSKVCGFGWNVAWNLRNDDLSQQSPETLRFLANLLKV